MKRPAADSLLCFTTPKCNLHCTICPVRRDSAEPDGASLLARMRAARQRGLSDVVFAGGEPLMRPDIFGLLAAARGAGLNASVVTNARLLLYEVVRKRLVESGCTHLRIQVFGGDADSHDAVTRTPGSFAQAVSGAEAFVREHGADVQVEVGLVLSGGTVADPSSAVEKIAASLPYFEIGIFVSICPDNGITPIEEASIRSSMDRISDWNSRRPLQPLLAFERLAKPHCPSPAPLLCEARQWAGCCGYVPMPDEPATPDTESPVANSFNYRATSIAVPLSAIHEACTVDTAAPDSDRDRDVWLASGESVRLYRTDTGDFAPPQIARVKWDFSDLYLDRSETAAMDDFTDSIRRVMPDPLCSTCPRRARCTQRHTVTQGPPFAREERWIAAALGRMRGRVLDVGCGEQLYRDRLAPLLRDGAIEYHGIDPDAAAIKSLHAALPQARLGVGTIEDFEPQRAYFDYVVALRSVNHFDDVRRALTTMTEALRPGGSMLLADCTPFALLRDSSQVAIADAAPRGGQQHLRNVSSWDLLPEIRLLALRVIFHRPVSRETGNLWIMQAMKI